ncbi:hypothetical protein DFH11DRAFT_1884055 [Phellopilus nigrolimitatus]|nr:hypothetical protein DFH11DRAFT_1884055 [Phellopilus nigrolimitatus]
MREAKSRGREVETKTKTKTKLEDRHDKRNAVLGLCRTTIKTIVLTSACQVRQAETTQRKALLRSAWCALSTAARLGSAGRPSISTGPPSALRTMAPTKPLRYSTQRRVSPSRRRASSWMDCAATSSVHGVNFAAEGKHARAKLVEENDTPVFTFAPAVADKVRNIHCLFHQLADADGRRDRGALLALLEHEKRVCEKEFGSDFDGLLSLIKLGSAVGSVCFSTSAARLFYVKL